ncbi:MAG: DUF1353 domain-containing protein [Bacteroidota bacterium]
MSSHSGRFTPSHTTQLSFINRPDSQFDTTVEITYQDPNGKIWVAPAGTVTDGASIPSVVAGFFGGKLNTNFLFAAIVHDAYCAEANTHLPVFQTETWQATHQMFYHACLANGTPSVKAKVMYAGVRLGGPRWSVGLETFNDLSAVSEAVIQEEMAYCKDWIEAQGEDLSLAEIDAWMEEREGVMLQ